MYFEAMALNSSPGGTNQRSGVHRDFSAPNTSQTLLPDVP